MGVWQAGAGTWSQTWTLPPDQRVVKIYVLQNPWILFVVQLKTPKLRQAVSHFQPASRRLYHTTFCYHFLLYIIPKLLYNIWKCYIPPPKCQMDYDATFLLSSIVLWTSSSAHLPVMVLIVSFLSGVLVCCTSRAIPSSSVLFLSWQWLPTKLAEWIGENMQANWFSCTSRCKEGLDGAWRAQHHIKFWETMYYCNEPEGSKWLLLDNILMWGVGVRSTKESFWQDATTNLPKHCFHCMNHSSGPWLGFLGKPEDIQGYPYFVAE